MSLQQKVRSKTHTSGFTLVELILVIVVIGILAAITIVGFGSWRTRTAETEVKSDASNLQAGMEDARNRSNTYPVFSVGTKFDGTNTTKDIFSQSKYVEATYREGNSTYFCIDVQSKSVTTVQMFLDTRGGNTTPQKGSCLGGSSSGGAYIQTITSANCPTVRTRAVDARDNHTYWVKKLADGKCWMLTNLGYAGGGTNTYGDVKTLTNGTGNASTFIVPSYYVVPSTTNFTTNPSNPSTSTNGTGQYGYLYNWCGAMGGQATAACASASTPTPNSSISICPAGWRLPSGGSTGDFQNLNSIINGGATNTDAGLLTGWLGQRSGILDSGSSQFINQNSMGYYWGAAQVVSSSSQMMSFSGSWVFTNVSSIKSSGVAVRCVAS